MTSVNGPHPFAEIMSLPNSSSTQSQVQKEKLTKGAPQQELTEFTGKSIHEKMNIIGKLSLQKTGSEGSRNTGIKLTAEGREVRHAVHELIKETSKEHVGINFLDSQLKILESTAQGKMARFKGKGAGSIKGNDKSYHINTTEKDKTKMGETEKTYHSFLDDLFEQLGNVPYRGPRD